MNPLARIKSCIRYSRRCSHGSLWNFIHGFSEATVRLNGITRENYKAFISDREYWEKSPYNGGYTRIIDNKLYLPYLLKDYPEHVPQYYYFLNHRIFRLGCGDGKPMVDFGEFLARLRTNTCMVLKHIGSSCGKGFYLLEYNDGCILNGERMTDADMQVFLKYVGWDVAITDDGFKIIEANSLTSLGVLRGKEAFGKILS